MTIICMNSEIWRNNIMDINEFENIDEIKNAGLKAAADVCNGYMLMAMQSRKLKESRKECLLNLLATRAFATALTDNSEIISKIDKNIQYYKDEIEGYDYIIKGCEKLVAAIQNLTDEATKSFDNDKESLEQFFDEMKHKNEETGEEDSESGK